ncbi:fimbria/pilus outer membrane usher protein [Glaciimonas immobilis]|uniref:Outer membrane usher protein FimD/PapC n=1 Tax=Glaciimonas immobilis TaxID=728004 RepID=A0A840RNP6_9BURK|nr:fimbria/pilus outer membrane usher protein [Glaciimonas immobilis]KAF3999266.1 fimbria/pilus outer membrane usher protein [Glaciimonas immobilis]MBB5198732.1 outer membrane usher protein FimD/PapC [Glaciimonas immobilis]
MHQLHASETMQATGESAPILLAATAVINGKDNALPRDGADMQEFDSDIMKARGLQPEISDYFRKAARFPPGKSIVDVIINGAPIGRKNAVFDETGKLCFSPSFLRSVGLIGAANVASKKVQIPPSANIATTPLATPALQPSVQLALTPNPAETSLCPGPGGVSAQTVVVLDASKVTVDITTPVQTIVALAAAQIEQGGTAAMFNYRTSTFSNILAGHAKSYFTQVDTQAGFNWNDWIVRSNQSYSNQNGQAQWRFANAYAQTTFVDEKQILQGGFTFTQGPMFSGIPFIGAQWFPETALRSQNKYPVTGIAATRARVVISQNGVILLSTVVPPGPFKLTDYQRGNRTDDLQVKVTEENGAEQRFTVAASDTLLADANAATGGIYASAGMLSDVGSNSGVRSVPLLTFEKGWQYNSIISFSTGALAAGKYASVGAAMGAQSNPLDRTGLYGRASAYVQALAARDMNSGTSGMLGSTSLAWANATNVQLGLSANLRTARYRSAQETQSKVTSLNGRQDDPQAASVHAQMGASVQWNSKWLGTLNVSVTHQTMFAAPATNTYAAGWSSTLGPGQLGVYLARTMQTYAASQGTAQASNQRAGQSNNSLFINFSVPLGHDATFTSNAHRSNNTGQQNTVIDTSIEQRLSDTFSYRGTFEKTVSAPDSGAKNISFNAVPRYTSISFGAGSAPGMSNYFVQASGGVVISGQGAAFAANPIQDTFAVVKLGDIAGVELNTPQGSVWSGYNGLAAIPGLIPFSNSNVEIVTPSLTSDIDVEQTVQVVRAGRGAFVQLDMKASKVQRVLLAITRNGEELPEGLPVFGKEGEFSAISLKGGRVMISDLKNDRLYSVRMLDGATCTLQRIALTEITAGGSFQRGTATCQ